MILDPWCCCRRTALHLAASEGYGNIVQYLLERGANPNARDRFGGTALHDSIRHHQPEAINGALKDAGCQLVGMDTAIALCEASFKGDLSAIQVLVENGVDPNLSDYDGRSALHLAASEGVVKVLDYLLAFEPKIDVNPVDVTGIYVCVYVYVCVCVCVCVRVCIHTYIYEYIHIYIYKYM